MAWQDAAFLALRKEPHAAERSVLLAQLRSELLQAASQGGAPTRMQLKTAAGPYAAFAKQHGMQLNDALDNVEAFLDEVALEEHCQVLPATRVEVITAFVQAYFASAERT